MHAVRALGAVKVDKNDKPLKEVKILRSSRAMIEGSLGTRGVVNDDTTVM